MKQEISNRPMMFLKRVLVFIAIGCAAGCLSAFFLVTLNAVTVYREQHQNIIWLLPLAGAAVGWLYHRFGKSVESGNNLILDEIHEPSETVPLRMIPLILIGTWLTHLFGGSAGREGTAVQMGASAADQFAKRVGVDGIDRSEILMAGMSAGFGSVFGVPFAGALFGIEVLAIGHFRFRFRQAFGCLTASFAGHWTVLLLGVQHTHYQAPHLPEVTPLILGSVALAGLLFGFAAFSFSRLVHAVGATFKKIQLAPLRAFIGGGLVIAGYFVLHTFRYSGLGVPLIEASLREPMPLSDWAYKSVFTILTLGSGMKGGEVTPLLFIGATLGNSLAQFLPVGFSLLAALGFVGVFAGAANTPLACTIMAMEIFGPGIGLLALLACYASWLVSGHRGIYRSQRIARYKPALRLRLRRSK